MKIRILSSLIGLLIGIAVGLFYGWTLSPAEHTDAALATMHPDYRTDYVLMTAEAYHAEQDLDLAQRRLSAISPQSPDEVVLEAMKYALMHNFTDQELHYLQDLAVAFRSQQLSTENREP